MASIAIVFVVLSTWLAPSLGSQSRMISARDAVQLLGPIVEPQIIPELDDDELEQVSSYEIQVVQPRISIPDDCLSFLGICPPNTVQVNDRCYRYIEIPLTWTDAKKDCEIQGGNLAIPDFHYNHTATDLSSVYRTIIGKAYIWIGATDMDSAFAWKWVNGTVLDIKHPNWYPGHPGNKNCASIYRMVKGRLQIYKNPCKTRRNFLCQFKALRSHILDEAIASPTTTPESRSAFQQRYQTQ